MNPDPQTGKLAASRRLPQAGDLAPHASALAPAPSPQPRFCFPPFRYRHATRPFAKPMFSADLLAANLLSPMVLAFALGMVAMSLRSDLEIPASMHSAMSIFLLLAIGLKGGKAIALSDPSTLVIPILVTIAAGIVVTLLAYAALRRLVGLSTVDAAAVAAHYGSVSAVTFIAARDVAERVLGPTEGLLVALVVALEIPAIVVGLWLGQRKGGGRLWVSLREVLTGRTMMLLGGGLLIGVLAGPERAARVEPLFVGLFDGVLMLFLLDLGMAAARRLRDVRRVGVRLVAFAMLMPVVAGTLGVFVAHGIGFSAASSAVFGAMLASASYIAAPAAVRLGLPEANPSLYLTAALGMTFPFNLAIGIPIYLAAARWLAS